MFTNAPACLVASFRSLVQRTSPCVGRGAENVLYNDGEECLRGRPVAATLDQEEIIMLGRQRQEAEPIERGHRVDGDAPIGAALRDGGGDSPLLS